jgi:hypothetical protein
MQAQNEAEKIIKWIDSARSLNHINQEAHDFLLTHFSDGQYSYQQFLDYLAQQGINSKLPRVQFSKSTEAEEVTETQIAPPPTPTQADSPTIIELAPGVQGVPSSRPPAANTETLVNAEPKSKRLIWVLASLSSAAIIAVCVSAFYLQRAKSQEQQRQAAEALDEAQQIQAGIELFIKTDKERIEKQLEAEKLALNTKQELEVKKRKD